MKRSVFILLLSLSVYPVVSMAQWHDVDIYCQGSGCGAVLDADWTTNLCGYTTLCRDGFFASYDFLPCDGSELTHLYVNNVDRINDISSHSSGTSGTVYTFGMSINTATTINAVFNLREQIPVIFSCVGDGSGEIQRTNLYDGNRCGSTDYYSSGFFASYDFLPADGSELTHLYVNNVDRVNDISSHSSGTSGTVYTFGMAVSTATSVVAMFDRRAGIASLNGGFGMDLRPNPAHDAAVVSIKGVSGTATVSVIDVQGRTLSTNTHAAGALAAIRIRTDRLAPGIYYVRAVTDDGKVVVKKLVVR